jgi:hypothetical protein
MQADTNLVNSVVDGLMATHMPKIKARQYPDKHEDLTTGQDTDFEADCRAWFLAVGPGGFFDAIDACDIALTAFTFFTTDNAGAFYKAMYGWLVEPVNDWLASQIICDD